VKTITKKHSFKQENIPLTFPLFKKSLKILENEFLIIYWEIGRQRTKKFAINTLTIPKIREIYTQHEDMGVVGWKILWRTLKFKTRYLDRVKEYIRNSDEFDILHIHRESGPLLSMSLVKSINIMKFMMI